MWITHSLPSGKLKNYLGKRKKIRKALTPVPKAKCASDVFSSDEFYLCSWTFCLRGPIGG